MQRKSKFIVAIASAIGLGAIMSASIPDEPPIANASDIIPSLSKHQQTLDRLAPNARRKYEAAGIDPATTRWLGKSGEFKYYAAPRGENDICLIILTVQDKANSMGCTHISGFEQYGLRFTDVNQTQHAWLLGNSAIADSVIANQPKVWTKLMPNFIIREREIHSTKAN